MELLFGQKYQPLFLKDFEIDYLHIPFPTKFLLIIIIVISIFKEMRNESSLILTSGSKLSRVLCPSIF